ncbi:MAG: hypothetical protein OXI83_02865 [Gemmatimonadota bacterium]|nr:hypothetical protein [Gemmatimonadota bacterium]
MVRSVTITLVAGEPTLVFWRARDFGKALDVSRDTGLPLTTPPNVTDQVYERLWQWIMEDPETEEDR